MRYMVAFGSVGNCHVNRLQIEENRDPEAISLRCRQYLHSAEKGKKTEKEKLGKNRPCTRFSVGSTCREKKRLTSVFVRIA